jgi:curved DNA-binding protein CbpA
MHTKDYYQLLNIPPSATLPEIKKAYRKLALQFHPDKNNNDAYAAAQFAEIKEAYEVLTNPDKKDYYLQQRWYEQSIGKRTKQAIITPVSLLQQALELERYVARLDVFRMDKTGLKDYTLGLLSDENIQKLKPFNEPAISSQLIDTLLKAIQPLPITFSAPINQQLYKLAGQDAAAIEKIEKFTSKQQRQYKREKKSLLIIIIVTLLLCLLIWLAGR